LPGLFCLLIFGAEGYCGTWSYSITHTHTHTHTQSVGLPWTGDGPVVKTCISQYTIFVTFPGLGGNSNAQSRKRSAEELVLGCEAAHDNVRSKLINVNLGSVAVKPRLPCTNRRQFIDHWFCVFHAANYFEPLLFLWIGKS
jgi:hypothetical protein